MRLIERWLTRWHDRQHEQPVILQFDQKLTEEDVRNLRKRLYRLYLQEGRRPFDERR